ncbi:hypothetical protein BGC30_04495 [Novacetimonas hansenii]|nr:hypothetical protein BGC30_04495 [Novacetimonas hansenii]
MNMLELGKVFGGCLFSKRRRLLKLFRKSFTKNLYNFRMLSSLTFQTVLQVFDCGLGIIA